MAAQPILRVLSTFCLTLLIAALIAPASVHAADTSSKKADSECAHNPPVSKLRAKFEDAIWNKDQDGALAVIKQGLDVKEADEYGNTPLILAVREGWGQAFKELVARGADI